MPLRKVLPSPRRRLRRVSSAIPFWPGVSPSSVRSRYSAYSLRLLSAHVDSPEIREPGPPISHSCDCGFGPSPRENIRRLQTGDSREVSALVWHKLDSSECSAKILRSNLPRSLQKRRTSLAHPPRLPTEGKTVHAHLVFRKSKSRRKQRTPKGPQRLRRRPPPARSPQPSQQRNLQGGRGRRTSLAAFLAKSRARATIEATASTRAPLRYRQVSNKLLTDSCI